MVTQASTVSDTHHLESTTDDPTEDVAVPKLVLRSPIIRQFHKVRKRVLLKDQTEALTIRAPVRNTGRHVQENLEADFAYELRRFTEVLTRAGVGLREEVFYQSQTNVVAHLIELSVDRDIVRRVMCSRQVAA